jgi:hypothetical protein
MAARLLKPLGNPQPASVKYFATSDIAELALDRTWLVKMTNALNQHWQKRNASKKISLPNGHGLPAREMAVNG